MHFPLRFVYSVFFITLQAIVLLCSIAQSYGAQKIPTPVIDIQQPPTVVYKNYLAFLQKFNTQFCSKETQSSFDRLSKRAQALNTYVPEAFDGSMDITTIQSGLLEIDKKLQWIIETRDRLKAQKSWPDRRKVLKSARDTIEDLLLLKERHFLKGEDTRALKKESKAKLQNLRDEFEKLVQELYFLKPYDYPVDHLNQRKDYDDNKARKNKKQAETANRIMFTRKLQEDGTFDANHDDPDVYLRTTLNTLSLALKEDGAWLSEDIRHDLEWALDQIYKQLGWGKKRQIERLQSWINRVSALKSFYQKLLNEKEGKADRQLFVESREASRQLKKFVYAKNAEVYRALLKEPELTQALYVFDQILLHEVGNATTSNFRDREDVAQVVINSRFHPELSVLDDDETLYKELEALEIDDDVLEKPSWLNVMFKELRFSFTLYYIPAVRHVFCPDFFRTAQITRTKNLNLITEMLREPKLDFHALRYYSRWSMIGRFDMSHVWKGFRVIPERVGARYTEDSGLKKAVLSGKYRYLYTFTELHGGLFHAIEVGNKIYAMKGSLEKPDFYAYRDPHKFRFFEEK